MIMVRTQNQTFFYQKGKIHLQFCSTNAAPSLAEKLTSLKLIFCKTFHTSWIEKPVSNVGTKFKHQIFFTFDHFAPYQGSYARQFITPTRRIFETKGKSTLPTFDSFWELHWAGLILNNPARNFEEKNNC